MENMVLIPRRGLVAQIKKKHVGFCDHENGLRSKDQTTQKFDYLMTYEVIND